MSYSPWGHKETDATERLNCTESNIVIVYRKVLRAKMEEIAIERLKSQGMKARW